MKKKIVHVIAHTHWDREWYQPFPQFRYRLIPAVDELLDRLQSEEGGEFAHFHLDGQTVVLEDYLAIRPERAPEIRELVGSGKLLVGPWYAQPDETLVSGEAMIRNLQIGMEEAEDLGEAMRTGYVPDIFGHIGQFPQLLRGFGIENALLWRGMVPPPPDKPLTEFRWRSPSGHEVLGIYLSTSGYFTAPQIDGAGGIPKILNELARKSASSHLLLMNGADHHHMQPDLPARVKELNAKMAGYELKLSTLPAYLDAVARELADIGAVAKLHTITGELRETRRSQEGLFLLYGTLSSRMPIKQANFRAQQLLERSIEPLAAMVQLAPQGRSSSTPASGSGTRLRSLRNGLSPWIRQLWKTLLKNHAHDSICGCSVDEVVLDMQGRFREVNQTGELFLSDLTAVIHGIAASGTGEIPDDTGGEDAGQSSARLNEARTGGAASAFRRSGRLALPFLLQNRAGVANRRVAEVTLRLPEELPPQPFLRAAAGEAHGFVVLDHAGRKLPVQPISVEQARWVNTDPRRFPTFREGYTFRFAFEPEGELPPLTAAFFTLTESAPADMIRGSKTEGRAEGLPTADGLLLRNELVELRIFSDGQIDIKDSKGRRIEDFFSLLDGGDIGDLYNYSPPQTDTPVSSRSGKITALDVIEAGPLLSRGKLSLVMKIPASAAAERLQRDAAEVEMPVGLIFTVRRGSPSVELEIDLENTAEDHRVRALVKTDSSSESSVAQATFSVERRPGVAAPVPLDLWREDPPNTHPQHGWCAAEGSDNGMAVLSRGLPEYELLGGGNTLAVTLLRAVERVHARDSLTIDRRAWGIPFRTPLAQCAGKHRFALAIFPFGGTWEKAAVDHEAERFLHPLQALQPNVSALYHLDRGPLEPILQSVAETGIIVSALKPEERGEGVVLRLWNNRDAQRKVHLEIGRSELKAERIDFRGNRIAEIAIRDRHIELSLGPWEIATLRLSYN